MAVRITTLGTLRIELDGQVLDRLPAARNRSALLIHLAVEREVTRDAAMGLLWPDRPPARARHLLSQTLYELRQELGDSWMETVGERLRVTDEVEVDAVELERAVKAGEFERAVALYGGPFLPGSALAVSRPMEGWIENYQARLVRLHRRARRGAIDEKVEAGELRAGLALARSWVDLDPLDDEAQHRLIELLARTGDRSGALRQYDRYAKLVETELELEPLDQTRELVERVRAGDVGGGGRAPEAESVGRDLPVTGEAGPEVDPGRPADEAAPTASRFDSWLDRVSGLRHRRTVQWTLTYLAAAVLLLEGLDVLTDAFGLPAGLLRMVALLLAVGAIIVLGSSWYLADRTRRFGKAEMALTLLVGVFLLSLPAWFNRATPAAGSSGPGLDPNRIAVLYFEDMSSDGTLQPLADGFTESLIHQLSQVQGLDVLSRRAVAPYREQRELPYDSMVATLQAGTLVEGSLVPIGDRIRLTIQLIDGETASHLMSTMLESSADSTDQLLVAMPDEAARLLRRRLGDWVRVQRREAAASSARALELVQRADEMVEDASAVYQTDLESALPLLGRADSMLAEAAALDPDWPEPVLMRAEVAQERALATADIPTQYEPEATATAFDHLDRVLERWPDYAPALAKRGAIRFGLAESGVGDEDELLKLYAQAEADLRKAVLLDPDLSEAWWGLSKLLLSLNEYAEAHRAAVNALDSDAFLTTQRENLWHLFWVTFNAEDHAAAQHWCQELRRRLGRGQSQYPPYCELILLTTSPRVSPDVDRAWRLVDEIVRIGDRSDAEVYRGYNSLQVAKVLVRAGMEDSARAVMRRVAPEPLPAWAIYDAAHLHLLLGDDDRALDILERYVEWNPVRAQRLARDWWFRRLHGTPRFQELLADGPG